MESEKLGKKIRNARYKFHHLMETEDGESDLYEITFKSKHRQDDKPIHTGVSVLQWSKYLILSFVLFLEEYLIDGSYKLLYVGEYG